MEPLQRQPKQPFKSLTGERLILAINDYGYPKTAESNSNSLARGRWLNIANTDAKTFFQEDYRPFYLYGGWTWPAVVLAPEEYTLRVGGMSVVELRTKLEEYWGRCGMDMWMSRWESPDDPKPRTQVVSYGNPKQKRVVTLPEHSPSSDTELLFNRWANGECAKWLGYFIAKNHTLGVVHAWLTAFSGITKYYQRHILGLLKRPSQGSTVAAIKFRMSFDMCMQHNDEEVDGLPSLPLNTTTTTIKGVQVIKAVVGSMYPRRIWDICANTVIPAAWFYAQDCPFTPLESNQGPRVWVRPVSHAWAADGDRTYIMTEANQQLWPIPLPRGVQLEDVRHEMIRLGVRYAWLDVLCLRQRAQPTLANNLPMPVSEELVEFVERREQRRLEEWKTDVPTIGAVYSSYSGLYGQRSVVIFMNGLGRPFRDEGWASERHWIRRAWTLQETPRQASCFLGGCLIAGLPDGVGEANISVWPWNCKVCIYHSKFYATKLRLWHITTQQVGDGQILHSVIFNDNFIRSTAPVTGPGEVPNLDALLCSIRQRHSSNLIDKVCSLALPLQRRMFPNIPVIFPIYDASTPSSVAWEQLICCIASTRMDSQNLCTPSVIEKVHGDLMGVIHTPTIQLLRLFPHPSRHHWFPSWAQVQQYPDVSVRDNDLGPPTRGIDCSLRIVSGRIYHGFSLKLIQPPTPEKQSIYLCTMGGRSTQLAAIVPGIELHIDSTRKYILVDISPDYSEWRSCENTDMGHEHLPIWSESVVLVCEEVDPHPTVDTCSVIRESNIMKYYLRRVTTLEWDCRLPQPGPVPQREPVHEWDSRLPPPGPGRWLPFKPSLEHMGSVVCLAEGRMYDSELSPCPPDVFCDPEAVAGLPIKNGRREWDKCPVYEVYLV